MNDVNLFQKYGSYNLLGKLMTRNPSAGTGKGSCHYKHSFDSLRKHNVLYIRGAKMHPIEMSRNIMTLL